MLTQGNLVRVLWKEKRTGEGGGVDEKALGKKRTGMRRISRRAYLGAFASRQAFPHSPQDIKLEETVSDSRSAVAAFSLAWGLGEAGSRRNQG